MAKTSADAMHGKTIAQTPENTDVSSLNTSQTPVIADSAAVSSENGDIAPLSSVNGDGAAVSSGNVDIAPGISGNSDIVAGSSANGDGAASDQLSEPAAVDVVVTAEAKNNSNDKKSKTEYVKSTHSKDFNKIDKLVPDNEEEFARLAPSTSMEFAELVGDNGDYGYPEGFPSPETYRLIVDLYHQVVMAFSKDENGDYTVPVRYMLCSSGADSSQSPTGTFKMKNYRVRYALFNNTSSYAQYWSLITGRIYFHSILYSSKNASSYTESYKKLGNNVSHGCIRLTVPDARWIWYNCAPETEVEIRKGSGKDKLTASVRNKLILADYPEERISLKAGDIPMTDNWTIDEIPHEVGFVQGSQ